MLRTAAAGKRINGRWPPQNAQGSDNYSKKVRNALGVTNGDRVTFIVNGHDVRVVNSAIYALERFQQQMKGEAAAADILSEEDIAEWITMSRREENIE